MLIVIFVAATIRPVNDDWSLKNIGNWNFHNESIIGKIAHKGIGPNNRYFSDTYYAESPGVVVGITHNNGVKALTVKGENGTVNYEMKQGYTPAAKVGDKVEVGTPIFHGKIINSVFYIDISRVLLLLIFVGSTAIVFVAYRRRIKENRLL